MSISTARKYYRHARWQIDTRILKRKAARVKVQGSWMFLDLVHPGISKSLYVHGIREAVHTDLIKEVLEPGMTVLDIGANIGYYAFLEARLVGPSGTVLAVEPDPRNIAMLRRGIEANGYEDIIEVSAMGMSNVVGEQEMLLSEKTNLNTFVLPDNRAAEQTITLPVTTVDRFLAERKTDVDLVRMDVEGFEVEILDGMTETLKRARPGFKILFELHPDVYSEERSLARQLERVFSLNYQPRYLVCAGESQIPKYERRGSEPVRVWDTDGYQRGLYENVSNEHAIELTCYPPKPTRYIMLEKM